MIILENETNHPVTLDKLEAIADTLTDRDIELVICDDDKIAKLNSQYRSIDKPTDVLSFPLEGDHVHLPLGTIVISHDHAQQKASELGHLDADEVALLFIHGLLHLLGYDHESDDGQMRAREHELIGLFELPDSLIVRTEDT